MSKIYVSRAVVPDLKLPSREEPIKLKFNEEVVLQETDELNPRVMKLVSQGYLVLKGQVEESDSILGKKMAPSDQHLTADVTVEDAARSPEATVSVEDADRSVTNPDVTVNDESRIPVTAQKLPKSKKALLAGLKKGDFDEQATLFKLTQSFMPAVAEVAKERYDKLYKGQAALERAAAAQKEAEG
jgi:hypothetical protein